MKKVEILLATYNSEKYVRALLDSVLAQTFTDWRLLIHDDGSSDKTPDILREYKSNFPEKILLLEDNIRLGGSSKNFSYLAEHSRSDYVAFCDQDDIWLPDKIAMTFERMAAAEGIYGIKTPLLIHTNLRVVGDSLKTLGDSFWKYQNLNPEISRKFSRLLVQNVVTGCTIMVNRPLLDLALPIPEGAVMHDWWLALVASAFGEIGYIASPTILYRQHTCNSVGAKKWGIKYILFELLRFFNDEFACSIQKIIRQAQEFQTRYINKIDADKRKTLQTFTGILSRNWLARRIVLIKYGLIKSGVIRNLGFLALMNNKYLPYLFQVSIFAFLSLPFESPVFFWVKLLVLLFLVVFAGIMAREDKKPVLFCGAFFLFLAFWGMLSLLRNITPIELILLEFKDFASLWLIMCVFVYFFQKKVITHQFYIQAVIRAAVFLSIFKLLLILGTFFYQSGGSNFSEFITLAKWAGIKYIGCPMSAGIYRVQFSADIVIPFLIFILFNTKKNGIAFGKTELYLYPVFFLLSVFFTYSRYIYFLALLIYLFSIIANRKNLLHIALVSGLSMAAIFGLAGSDGLYQVLKNRIPPNSAENRYSDVARQNQAKMLLSEFYSHPVLGKGLGSYMDSFVRDERLKYSYEVQIVAMLMKFGVLGMIILCSFLIVLYSRPIPASAVVRFDLPLLSLFFFWLFSGFTNPYLVSSYSAIVFILFYSLFYLSPSSGYEV